MSLFNTNFEFENSNGRFYSVTINQKTGVGHATVLAAGGRANARADNSSLGKTRIALAIDAGFLPNLPARHVSYLYCAPIYNTAKTLNAVLNAAF